MLTNLKNPTNRELIEVLKQYPMDATVSIETSSLFEECNAIKYSDLGNEIILSHSVHFGTSIEEFIEETIDIFEQIDEDEEDLYRACGIW